MAKKKKKTSVTKLLTGQHIKGLDKKKSVSRYEEGALFSQVESQMKKMIPLSFQSGGMNRKYPDGGIKPTGGNDDTVTFDEEVVKGSARHKELLDQEKKYQSYLGQQEKYAPLVDQFGEPINLTVDEFKRKYPQADQSYIPKGTTNVLGFTYNPGEGSYGQTPAPPIYATTPDASGGRATTFFPGYEDVASPPKYDVYDPLEGDTIIPEDIYTPPVEPHKTVYMKQRAGANYVDAEGKNVTAPMDAVWNSDNGMYYDAATGRVFNPYKGTVTVDPNFKAYDPGTATTFVTGVPTFAGGGMKMEAYYTTLGDVLRDTFKTSFAEGGGKQKKESLPQLLAGDGITALEKSNKVQANAEVEDGEYIKFPDNTVQKAQGEKHANGGIDLHIPDGTKILSNKRMLTKKEAADLNKEHELNVTTKHTYSEAIDKYVAKIGLKRLYDDQEELFEQLKKVVDDSQSEGSSRVNKEYLSKKIHKIETQKEEKEKLKADIFDKLFTMQEVTKRSEESTDMDAFFEAGGISRETFKKVVNRYGLSEREGVDLYRGKMPTRFNKKYPDGGEHGDAPKTVEEAEQWYKEGKITREQADYYETVLDIPPVKFNTTTGEHEFSNSAVYAREKQSAGEAAFGKITKENLPVVLNNLYRNFPDIVAEEYGVVYNDDGTVSFDENINFAEASKAVENFQTRAQTRMTDTANLVINNPDSFQPEYVQSAHDYLKNETFDESLARGIDSKQGQFTSGRYSLGIDVVTPEEHAELTAKGIFTTKQLQTAVDSGEVVLSQPSLTRLQTIRELTPEGTDPDFAINSLESGTGYTPKAAPGETAVEPVVSTPITNDIKVPAKKYPKLFASPDQTPLPPSALEAHLMGNIRLERIDPVRLGIEPQLQQASDAIKEGSQALAHLPPNQRAAAIVGLQANVQKGINDAIYQANVTNAQNQASAELFNIGQSGQEEQLRLNNLLSFEQRQLTAKAKTEEEVRNYYDQLNRISVNNFRNNQDLSLLQTMSPDYSLNSSGTGIEFTPEGDWKVQDNSNLNFEGGGKYKKLFSNKS